MWDKIGDLYRGYKGEENCEEAFSESTINALDFTLLQLRIDGGHLIWYNTEIFCSISWDIRQRKSADFRIDCYVMLKGHISLSGKRLTLSGSKGFLQKSQPNVIAMGLWRFCARTCNLIWGNFGQIFHFWVCTYIWKISSINGHTYSKMGMQKEGE